MSLMLSCVQRFAEDMSSKNHISLHCCGFKYVAERRMTAERHIANAKKWISDVTAMKCCHIVTCVYRRR